MSEGPESMQRSKKKDSGAQSAGGGGALDSRCGPHYPSRRKDIFKGLAKVKALEAAKRKCTSVEDPEANLI
jgi:hypothetical protein